MIVELRRYSLRGGSIDKMHRRMRDVLLPLFSLHGVPSPFAIWTTDKPTGVATMTWMLNWTSLEVRNATWAAFRPIWEEAKAKQVEEEFVTRTDLTLITPWPSHELAFSGAPGACESAWMVQPEVGQGGAFRLVCNTVRFPSFLAAGAIAVVANDFMFGPLPQSLIFVSWPDPETRGHGMNQITQLPGGAKSEASSALASTLAASGGNWERLNRAPYLGTWKLRP